jgi:general secretion pathway protein G
MMSIPQAKLRSGFTLIELAVVVAIVGILAAALLSRALFYQEQAERAGMEQLLGNLRSALHLQIAAALIKGNPAAMGHLADQNPMDWLAEKPTNYVGEYYAPRSGLIGVGSWYFDLNDKNLVYLANNHAHLHTAPGELNKIRFKVKPVTSFNGEVSVVKGVESGVGNSVEGITLEPAVPYSWF